MRLKVGLNRKEGPVLKSYISEFFEKMRDRFWFRVLVVEDSPDSRNLLKLAMDTLPCSIDYAEDGHRARHMIERNKPYDLIIVDQELPDTNGLKILEACDRKPRINQVEDGEHPPIPFIVYSGLDLRPMTQMKRFKFADFIKKPTNIVSIHDRIEQVLRSRELYRNQTGVGQNL